MSGIHRFLVYPRFCLDWFHYTVECRTIKIVLTGYIAENETKCLNELIN